jgi:KTSC domain
VLVQVYIVEVTTPALVGLLLWVMNGLQLADCHLRRMRRVLVESSSVASIGYEAETRELEIEFRESGDVYRYFDVPREEYGAFLAAESKGSYLNLVFKVRGYRYLLVRRGEIAASPNSVKGSA